MSNRGFHEVHLQCGPRNLKLARLKRRLPDLRLNRSCDPSNIPVGSQCYEYPAGREAEFESAARAVAVDFEWGGGASAQFQVYRVKSDNTLVLVGSCVTTDAIKRMARQSDFFYGVAADGSSTHLTVIDARKPNAPQQVAYTVVGTIANGVAVQGPLAFVFGTDVEIVDVTVPTSPRVIGSLIAVGTENYQGGDVAGDYIYAIDGDAGALVIVNHSDPTAPVIVGTLSLGFTPKAVKLFQGVAHIAGSAGEIALVKVDNPASPSLIAGVSASGQAWEFIGVWGGVIFLTGQSATGVGVWEQAGSEGDPPTLTQNLTDTPINHTSQLDVAGRRAFFASGGTLYNYRIGGFFCHAIATGALTADELKAEKVEARHGYFKGELVARTLTVFGATFETEGGALFVANYIQLGDRVIAWGAGDPETVLTANPGSIFMSDDGNIYRKSAGAGNTGWLAV